MTELQRLSRRLFVKDTSRAIGFVVLGGGVLAACSSDGEVTVLPATDDSTTSAAPTESSSTSTPNSTSTTQEDSIEDAAAEDNPVEWTRVVLGSVSAYVLGRGREVAIVDTGTAGNSAAIEDALTTMGAGWDDVNHVVLTHLHSDHIGSLPEVLELATGATPWAGAADIAGISSPREIQPLSDGDEVFGLQVIGTPGHTAGHISVLDPIGGLLVAGDALNESGGMVLGPNPTYSSDHAEAISSVTRLAERQFETVVFGHGDPFEGGGADAVVALAQTL